MGGACSASLHRPIREIVYARASSVSSVGWGSRICKGETKREAAGCFSSISSRAESEIETPASVKMNVGMLIFPARAASSALQSLADSVGRIVRIERRSVSSLEIHSRELSCSQSLGRLPKELLALYLQQQLACRPNCGLRCIFALSPHLCRRTGNIWNKTCSF